MKTRIAVLGACLAVAGCQYQTVRVQIEGSPSAIARGDGAATDPKAKVPGAPDSATLTSGPVSVTVTQSKPVEVSPGRELSPARDAQVKDNTVPVTATP